MEEKWEATQETTFGRYDKENHDWLNVPLKKGETIYISQSAFEDDESSYIKKDGLKGDMLLMSWEEWNKGKFREVK